ncbi:MAG: Aminotransferase, class III [uncultured Thermomicrobiales bacterium]|uniref:Aminotransferase, class III n=1 Tax=uncultured Thermomicrobiales bacterium TaxID=1645740 RepID=A0A6J4UFM1_9BACT|nr:MAG: Aminotransferase, class III [uncultured Thermomicrobiales bacterium]
MVTVKEVATGAPAGAGAAALVDAVSPAGIEREAMDHVWIHSQPWLELAERGGLRVFDRGEGSTLWDVQGRDYLDGIAGLWVVNAGHGRAEIAEAMGKQAAKLAYVSASSFTTGPAAQLAHTLAEVTPGDLNRVFFCSGGSEAVETAVKIAKQVQAMRGFPRRYKVIARRGSYHGMTMGAMSLTAMRNEAYFGPFMYGVSHVPHPNRYRSDFGVEGEQADIMAARYVEQEIESQGPDTVACVIGEPVSSAAGVHVPSPVYWQMLREICDKHGVLLICDEVINGFGRTGKLFATEHFGIVPDIITIAKGLSSGYAPIAAAIVRDSVFDTFKDQGEVAMGHLLTFGGHPVCAVAAQKNLEIFAEENLVAQAAEKGEYLKARLEELRAHPTVGDVRGVGLLTAIEIVRDKEAKTSFAKDSAFIKTVNKEIMDRRLITRVWNVIHFAPPLVVTHDEIDRMVTIVDEALTAAERAHAGEFVA